MEQASDDAEIEPASPSRPPAWCYAQPSKRGIDRTFSGHIDRIHGTEAEMARKRLAAATTDLLRWARESAHSGLHEDGDPA